MDNRNIMKEFVDMDELSRPWESDNKLIINGKSLPKHDINSNIVEYIKMVKYMSLDLEEKSMQRKMKKR